MSLVQSLPEGPTDIVGDVHGEFDALQTLLARLGYPEEGAHPQGRQLVFTGDLVDRGPDSPAVMERVIALVESGVARCVLGNHELNILRGVRKGGNDWLLDAGQGSGAIENPVVATPGQAREYLAFLELQPFALCGPHLRVVHACWHAASISKLRELESADRGIGGLYREIEAGIVARLEGQPVARDKLLEVERYGDNISDPDWHARSLPAHASVDLALQTGNPLRMLTTSEEQVAAAPFWAGGKWRMTERARWWDHYTDRVPVIIGHFWRMFDNEARRITGMFGADVFEGVASHEWMGLNRNVYCVDYSVGQRHLERREPGHGTFRGKLAALRYPDWEVLHDDGAVVAIGEPGLAQL